MKDRIKELKYLINTLFVLAIASSLILFIFIIFIIIGIIVS